MKHRRPSLLASLAVATLLGCSGGGASTSNTDGGTDTDATTLGTTETSATTGPSECTLQTLSQDCPDRPCEVATGCEAGACVYEPFVCGNPGEPCPAETCVSDEFPEGVVNRCEVVPNGPCGDGLVCMGLECVPEATGLTLEASLYSTARRENSGPLHLNAALSRTPISAGPQSSGTLKLTGGLQP